tara:strand:- start:182 stop:697 length:516 start_codon:yes stop_codon:yes gene_type:complete
MPITPFHIIAGFAVKSIFNKHFSWSIFALTNIIIDVEVIYYILTIGEASHKFFHTLIGSSIVALSCAIIGIPICERLLKFWNKNLQNEKSLEKLKWLSTDTNITIFSSFTGAFVGAYSHIILDSLMHFDVKPFEPFFSKTFVGIISSDLLHILLVGLFVFGSIVFFVKKFK